MSRAGAGRVSIPPISTPAPVPIYARFWVPGTPVPKQSAKRGRGHFYSYRPEAVKNWQDKIRLTATTQYGTPDWRVPFNVFLAFYLRNGKEVRGNHVSTPDAENLAKPVLDALKGRTFKGHRMAGLIWDDSWVSCLCVSKCKSENEGVAVEIIGL
jgi:Holliday junction resolvase RusA-like endonuclease